MKVPEILKLLGVHKDIREEHPFAGLVVQEGIGDAMSFVLGNRR
jgi:hypothetical protein